MMISSTKKFVVVALTQDLARIWRHGLEKGMKSENLSAPDANGLHRHVRQMQHHGGHTQDPAEQGFFDILAEKLRGSSEVLILGHGSGKANAMDRFFEYVGKHDPQLAKQIMGRVEADLNALSDDQILAKAREWFDWYHRQGAPITKTIR